MPPSGYDEELAALFRDLRRALDASEDDVATRLDTDVEVIRALEEGALASLPPFAETSRIVIAYTSILGLDARPILRRIHGQLVSRVTAAPPPQPQNDPASRMHAPRPQPVGGERRPATPQSASPQPMQELRPGQGRPGPNQPPRPGPGQPPRPGPGQPSRPVQGPQRRPPAPPNLAPGGLEQVRPLRPGHGAPDDRPVRGPAPQARRGPEPPFRSEPPQDYDAPEFVEDANMGEDDAEPRPARFRGPRRWLRRYGFYAVSGLVTLTVLTLLIFSPGTVVSTLEGMPPPFPTIAEAIRNVLAPGPGRPAVSEDDPRSRKADKLPVPSE